MLNIQSEKPARAEAWLLLLLSVLVCLPPLFIAAGATEPDRIMENHTMVSSQETWIRQCGGERDAWLMPTWNGRPRIEKPPMSVWLNMIAWSGLTPSTSTTDQLVTRARCMAAGFAALALISVFWAGMSVSRNPRLAALAVLVTGTSFAFVKQGRFATYDTHMLGFVTLAVAAGLWALQPGARRWWLGWLISGFSLGAAVLVKGPLAFALAAGPLALAAATCRGARVRAFAGWALALIVAALCAAPWTLYMYRHVPEVTTRLAVEYLEPADVNKPPWYYLALIGTVFPWSLWFAIAAVQPVIDWKKRREGVGFPWLWFVFIFLMFSIPGAKSQRYIMPVLPAAGLLVAGLCGRYVRDGRSPAWLRRAHWGLLLIASVAVPVFLGVQEFLLSTGRIPNAELPGFGIASALGWGMALIGIAFIGRAWHGEGNVLKAAVATALWGVVLLTPGHWSQAHSARAKYPQRVFAELVASECAGRPLAYLAVDSKVDVQPTKIFLFYSRRIIPPVTPDELRALAERGEAPDVIVRAGFGRETILEPMGFRKVCDFADDTDRTRSLFRSVPRDR